LRCQTEQQAVLVHDPSEGLVDFLIRVYDVDVICLLVERPAGEIKGSLRTSSKTLDMGAIAKQLGGGGHKIRGGFSQYDQPMQQVKDKVIAAITQHLDRQENRV
jgi:nanoRNase/pAp phosphatase (c-di-AMP/oligoRNAs hydrolase)